MRAEIEHIKNIEKGSSRRKTSQKVYILSNWDRKKKTFEKSADDFIYFHNRVDKITATESV